jgi:hypothetical protein
MLEEIMKEFKNYREAVYERVSEFMNYTDAKHQKNADQNTLSTNGLCELTTELDSRITELEDAVASMMGSADDTTTTTETSK